MKRFASSLLAVLLLGIAALSFGADVAAVVGPPRSARLSGTALDEATKETSSLLRCPVCQGLSIADSPATMAVKMREQVRELHAAGYDREQVMAYFERSYGEFVRLEPPRRGINWLVWLAPLAALVAGAIVIAFVYRSIRARRLPEPPVADADLQPYIDRIRAIAYGAKPPEER